MKICLFTVVDEKYKWYIPLFITAAKKAYPDYDIRILATFDAEHEPLPEFCNPYVIYECILHKDFFAANYRFLYSDESLLKYDYVLITDIDIIIMPEKKPLHEFHIGRMKNAYYENFCHDVCQCSGVHFVSHAWWNATEKCRDAWLLFISSHDLEKDHDEYMLYHIIQESGLPVPKPEINQDYIHGIHLGKFRGKYSVEIKYRLNGHESVWVNNLFKDNDLLQHLNVCVEKIPRFNHIYRYMESYTNN